ARQGARDHHEVADALRLCQPRASASITRPAARSRSPEMGFRARAGWAVPIGPTLPTFSESSGRMKIRPPRIANRPTAIIALKGINCLPLLLSHSDGAPRITTAALESF